MQHNPDSAPVNPPTRNPQWWTDGHASAWERVKESFRRDWEQTKADFSLDGQTLNQGIGDTVKQALGTQPVPAPEALTHPHDPKIAAQAAADEATARAASQKEANRAFDKIAVKDAQRDLEATKARAKASVKGAERHLDAVKDTGRAREDMGKEQARAAEVISKATAKVVGEYGRMEEAAGRRDVAVARWNHAEQEARYGYAARTQHATVTDWNDSLEEKLRAEWEALGTGRTWADSREGIRRGWDYARTNH